MEELQEESGLACCICREGYKYHPQKVCCIFGNEAYLKNWKFTSNVFLKHGSLSDWAVLKHHNVK